MPNSSPNDFAPSSDHALLERAVRIQAITTEITAMEDPDAIPGQVVAALVRELDLSVASLVLRDPETGELSYAAEYGVPEAIKALGFRAGGNAQTVLASGEPIFIEDAADDPRVSPNAKLIFRAWACLPVRHRDRAFGLLFVNFPKAHPFPPIERHILAIFANQTAIALDNARLHRALQQRARDLAALASFGQDLALSLEAPDLVRVLQRALLDHLPEASGGILWLREGTELQPAMQFGLPAEAHFKPLLDRDPNPGFGPAADLFATLGCPPPPVPEKALAVALPLRAGGESVGLLVLLAFDCSQAFGPPEMDFLQSLADRTALALHNAALYAHTRQAARRDSLTQLLNHGAFQSRLLEVLPETRPEEEPLALLMIDADHFKRCNDTHGHPFGDQVLVALAHAIRDQVRPTDAVGRWGGEEFTVLLNGLLPDAALRVAERIRRAMEELSLTLPDGRSVSAPTVSIGVACFPGCERTPGRLLEAADQALYRAKAEGRNRVCAAPGIDPQS